MRLLMILLSPIAGVAQFLRGRFVFGVVLLFLWIAALNGALVLGPGLMPPESAFWVKLVSWCVFGIVTIVSVIDILLRTNPRRVAEIENRKNQLLLDGINAYLRDDLDAAVRFFSEMARLDVNDADARMYLAMAFRARGDTTPARRQFKHCRALDRRKWSWEVAEELKSLTPPLRSGQEK